MSKLLFCSTPYRGHVQPTLALVQELVARGMEVSYYTTENFRDLVQGTGATFHPYISDHNVQMSPVPPVNECFFVLPQILSSVRASHIDCIVYEKMCFWGKILARILKVPAVMLYTDYAANEHFSSLDYNRERTLAGNFSASVREDIKRLCKVFNIPPFDVRELFFHAEDLNLIFMPRAFHPLQETFPEPRFQFVGPSLYYTKATSDFLPEKFSHQPLIYASLGTNDNDFAGVYDIILTTLHKQPQQSIISLGNSRAFDFEVFGPLPENVMLFHQVPQLEVLDRTDLFITHGGMNSVMEALARGIPLIVVPMKNEQAFTGRRVEELKVGLTIPLPSFTSHTLSKALERIRSDEEFRANAQRMQKAIVEAGGYKKAVDSILEYMRLPC